MYIYIDTKIVLHPLFHEHENNKMKTFLWQHFFFFFFDMSVHTLQGTMKCKNINVMLCVTTNKKTIKLLIIVNGVNCVRWLVGIYYKQKLGKIIWNVSLTTNICKSNLTNFVLIDRNEIDEKLQKLSYIVSIEKFSQIWEEEEVH